MFVRAAGLVALAYVGLLGWRIARFAVAARRAAHLTQPYESLPDGAGRHVLVLGDSTMYGAGTVEAANTVGGLLAAKFPGASVETRAVNGARVRDLPAQLRRARFRSYDLVVVGIGGNDIVRGSSYRQLADDLAGFLDHASPVARQIALCHSGNVGNIGFFPFPLDRLYDVRSRRLSQVFRTVASRFSHVVYVDFYRPKGDDHYDRTTRPRFIAADGFHPSDYANRYFFDLIWKALYP